MSEPAGFSKSKQLDKKGESIVDRIGELRDKAVAVSEADTGGSEAARLRKMLDRVTGELEQVTTELDRVATENKILRSKFKKVSIELAEFLRQKADVEDLARKVKALIKKYGEFEAGLDKAIDKALDDLGRMRPIEIELPEDLNL